MISPGRGIFDLDLSAVWRYRELLFVLIMRHPSALQTGRPGRRLGATGEER